MSSLLPYRAGVCSDGREHDLWVIHLGIFWPVCRDANTQDTTLVTCAHVNPSDRSLSLCVFLKTCVNE